MIESDRIFEDVRGDETMVATDMMATETVVRAAAVKLNWKKDVDEIGRAHV